MDINDLRIAVTLGSFVLFVALMARTWSRRRRAEYEAAALMPFGDETVASPAPRTSHPGARL